MKKVLLATTAVVALAGSSLAQDLTIGGFVEFEADYGDNYDLGENVRSVDDLDFSVDAGLNFDYSNSTKSGLEYGAHFELDMFSSDAHPTTIVDSDSFFDIHNGGQSDVLFNDAYVFINSALGNVKLGDTGTAGKASNQLNVPFLAPGAIEGDNLASLELEQVHYSNSFVGVDFEASVDDDSNWALGIGYSADVGGVTVGLGLSAAEEALAGSINMTAGGLAAGVNYAMEEVGGTSEYVAAGVSYSMGALSVGSGVETQITHDAAASGEEYVTNYHVGATYELADGLVFGVGVANLDSDSCSNWTATGGSGSSCSSNTNNKGLLGQGQNRLDHERRTWTAGASVKVSF